MNRLVKYVTLLFAFVMMISCKAGKSVYILPRFMNLPMKGSGFYTATMPGTGQTLTMFFKTGSRRGENHARPIHCPGA
jgi:hypothetical protein